MSSYICSAKHFNSIEENLIDNFQFDQDFKYMYDLKELCPELYQVSQHSERTIKEKVRELVDGIRRLNVICVSLQYAHHYENVNDEIEEQTKIAFDRSTDTKKLTLLGLYNALRCTYYQIELEHLEKLSENDEKENISYRFLSTMIDFLAHLIVRKLPDDKTNTWEIN